MAKRATIHGRALALSRRVPTHAPRTRQARRRILGTEPDSNGPHCALAGHARRNCLEATNVFNFVNLVNPGTNLYAPATFGKIRAARDMRRIQLGTRLSF